MEEIQRREKEREYLDKFIFFDLENLNTGFDVPCIKYFSEHDFETILERVYQNQIGIWGIEAWQHGEFYEVTTCPDGHDATDPRWFNKAFSDIQIMREVLQYSGTYFIQEHLLENL